MLILCLVLNFFSTGANPVFGANCGFLRATKIGQKNNRFSTGANPVFGANCGFLNEANILQQKQVKKTTALALVLILCLVLTTRVALVLILCLVSPSANLVSGTGQQK